MGKVNHLNAFTQVCEACLAATEQLEDIDKKQKIFTIFTEAIDEIQQPLLMHAEDETDKTDTIEDKKRKRSEWVDERGGNKKWSAAKLVEQRGASYLEPKESASEGDDNSALDVDDGFGLSRNWGTKH